MPTARDITPEEMAVYRETARRRHEREREELERRQERAWEIARLAASLLKDEFGVSRVVAFGSLTREGQFTHWSDLDIAAWGIRSEDTFRAIDAVMHIDPEIEVNLVDVEMCRPSLLEVIEQEGVEL